MKFHSDYLIDFEKISAKHFKIKNLKSGLSYYFKLNAFLGDYDLNKMFFTLPSNQWRKKEYLIGPVNLDFGNSQKYLPPRIDIFINKIFYYSMWFEAPHLCEFLNDPELPGEYPFLKTKKVNYDDGWGQRKFRFHAEGGVPVESENTEIELIFPDDFGAPEVSEITVDLDQRYQRAKALSLPAPTLPHPRLYMDGDAGKFAQTLRTDSPELLDIFLNLLDAKKFEQPEAMALKNLDGLEHWDVFDRAANYAFGYALTQKIEYFEIARKHVEFIISRPHWGDGFFEGRITGEPWSHFGCDNDLSQGITPTLAVIYFYDWCYHQIQQPFKQQLEERILHQAEILFKHSSIQMAEWGSQYSSDHHTGGIFPLQLAGFILGDKYPQAEFWIKWGRIIYETGAPQGYGTLWSAGSPQLRLPLLAYELLCQKYYPRRFPVLAKAEPYTTTRLMMCVSNKLEQKIDGIYGCDAQAFYGVARLTGNGHAQWLAERLANSPIAGWLKTQGFRKVMELIFRNPQIKTETPALLPRVQHAPEFEFLYYRENWQSIIKPDEENIIVGIENRLPRLPLNKNNEANCRPNFHYSNPFQGHFFIIKNGSNYVSPVIGSYIPSTENGNTLKVDQLGQIGEGSWLYPKVSEARIAIFKRLETDYYVENNFKKAMHIAELDLSPVYPANLDLRYIRTMIIYERLLDSNQGSFEKMEIYDDIDSSQLHEYVLFCHTSKNIVKCDNLHFQFSDDEQPSILEVKIQSSAPVSCEICNTEVVWTYMPPAAAKIQHIQLKNLNRIKNLSVKWEFKFQ